MDSGKDLVAQGDTEAGLTKMQAALKEAPNNILYREQYERARTSFIESTLVKADRLRAQGAQEGAQEGARSLYERVLSLDPNNVRARVGIDAIQADQRHQNAVADARRRLAAGDGDTALTEVQAVLAEDPGYRDAVELRRQIELADVHQTISTGLRAALRKPVTLEFHDADLKSVFEALARSTGVNFVFDREVKPDLKVTIYLQKTSVEDAIGVLTVTNQLKRKFLNDNTVLIYPDTPTKQKDYQDLMVKTFYLGNADAAKIATMLKTVLHLKDVYADDKLNSVTVRDTPGGIDLVQHMIAAQDLADPEVTLEVEILEVQRSRLTQLGVNPPSDFTLLNIVPGPTQTVAANGTVVTNVNPVTTTSQLTVDNLRHFNGGSIGIPSPKVDVHAELGNSNLLANPRIRVKSREKAHILIGDKVPVITTTTTANVGVAENISYLDVGLKLDVEPVVYLDNEVGMTVGLEVSSIVKQVETKSGALTYQIGTRAATTELRLKDGETQALAGLINDQERHSASGLPGMIDLPLVNRLFSTASDQHDKTEIVLLITPHIVRNLSYSADIPLAYPAGTEGAIGGPLLRLSPGASLQAPPEGKGEARRRPVVPEATPEETPEETTPTTAPATDAPGPDHPAPAPTASTPAAPPTRPSVPPEREATPASPPS